MNIQIDIGHPAHVHYFRNFYKEMNEAGHKFLITARKKEVSHELLDAYKIPYISRGSGSNSMVGKFTYLPKANYILLREALKFKPDIFMSFSSPYAAQVSSILRKPHIAFDDTEHAKLGRLMYRPFTDLVLSPDSYNGKLETKQILFDGYMELCYLHPNVFEPDVEVLKFLGVEKGEKYAIVRFVSWNATHDVGHGGISFENKERLISELTKLGKVFISSEAELPVSLKKYKIDIPPSKMHDVLNYASLFIGESATMASESAMLGTPAIYIDNDGRGYTDDLENKYKAVFNYTESENDQVASIKKAVELFSTNDVKELYGKVAQKIISDKIDVTKFLKWVVNNYPQSVESLRRNKDEQYSFR